MPIGGAPPDPPEPPLPPLPPDPDYRRYLITVGPLEELTYDVTCTLGPGGQRDANFELDNVQEGPQFVEDDGVSILDFSEPMNETGVANYLELWSWKLSDAPPQP